MKADWCVVDSPKKWTNEFGSFAVKSRRAEKSFGRIYGTPICLRLYLTFRWRWHSFTWCNLTLLSNRTQKIGEKSAPPNSASEVTLIEVQLHIKISFGYLSRMCNIEQFWAILQRLLLVSGCRSNWRVSLIFMMLIFWCLALRVISYLYKFWHKCFSPWKHKKNQKM